MKHGLAAVALVGAAMALPACAPSNDSAATSADLLGSSTTRARITTTSTTLSPTDCAIEIEQVQAGVKALTDFEYESECGALPEGVVLDTTTTTTTTTVPPTTTTVYVPPSTRATAPPAQNCPNGGYTNSIGNYVCSPYQSPSAPPGATAQCRDGSYSFSQSRSGTCSSHGGVAVWL